MFIASRILISTALILGQFAVETSITWESAPRTVLEATYMKYELCVLDKASNGIYDITKTIHEQPACKNFVDDNMNRLPRRCWLGSRQQRSDDGICVSRKKYATCTPLVLREGFWKHWAELELSRRNQLGYAGEVLDAVRSLGFEIMAFASDSMAIQMSQRLLCSILRRNASVGIFGDFFSVGSSGGVSAFIKNTGNQIPISFDVDTVANSNAYYRNVSNWDLYVTMYRVPNGIGLYKVTKKWGAIPDIEKTCGLDLENMTCRMDFASRYIERQTLQEFNRYMNAKKWGKMLHIYVLPIIVKDPWEYVPLARALLAAADTLRPIGSRLLVMSPLAQHFGAHPLGQYVNITKDGMNGRQSSVSPAPQLYRADHTSTAPTPRARPLAAGAGAGAGVGGTAVAPTSLRNSSSILYSADNHQFRKVEGGIGEDVDSRGNGELNHLLVKARMPLRDLKELKRSPVGNRRTTEIHMVSNKHLPGSGGVQSGEHNRVGAPVVAASNSEALGGGSGHGGRNRHSKSSLSHSTSKTSQEYMPDERVCPPHTGSMGDLHPDSVQFLAAIDSVDPEWRRKLGWLDVARYSVPWHDLHPESGSTGWIVDCTHYAYSPLMYEAIWAEVAVYLRRGDEWVL